MTVPTWRARDVTREADLIEEVARFVLDEVPFTLAARAAMRSGACRGFCSCGARSRMSSSGAGSRRRTRRASSPTIRIRPRFGSQNPLSGDQAVLRTTLLPSLLAAAERNREVGNDGVALFEIARVYLPSGAELPNEGWRVAGVLEGEFADAKGVVDALFEALHLELGRRAR